MKRQENPKERYRATNKNGFAKARGKLGYLGVPERDEKNTCTMTQKYPNNEKNITKF